MISVPLVTSLLALVPAAAAGLAGLTARRVVRREAEAERRYRPWGLMLRIKGYIVHAEIAGDGPDLILLHGASGNSREFTFGLIEQLASHFRVIAFDRPGLGWSDDLGPDGIAPAAQAAILRGAAARLGVHRPLILGHSYGAAVALAWALEAQKDVAGLVIVSGATCPWKGGLGAWYALTSSPAGAALALPLVTAWASPRMIDRTVASIFAPEPVPEGYPDHAAIPLTLRRKVMRANAAQVNGLLPYVTRMAPLYPELKLPVEIVHGTADTITPMQIHAEPLAAQLPDAHLTRLHGVGHMPHHTRPAAIIAAVHSVATRARAR